MAYQWSCVKAVLENARVPKDSRVLGSTQNTTHEGVMFNIDRQLEICNHPEDRAFLQGTVSVVLIEVGRPIHCGHHRSLDCDIGLYKKSDTKPRARLPVCRWDETACPEVLLL